MIKLEGLPVIEYLELLINVFALNSSVTGKKNTGKAIGNNSGTQSSIYVFEKTGGNSRVLYETNVLKEEEWGKESSF